MAAGQNKPTGVRLMASGDTLRVLCPDAQDIRGGSVLVDIRRAAVNFLVTEAPEGACTGKTSTRPKAVIPPTTTAPCRADEFPAVDAGINQVSRHVHCQSGAAPIPALAYTPPNQPTINYAPYRLEWKIGSDGLAKDLNKTYRIKLRLVREPGAGETLSGLRVLPVFDCGARCEPRPMPSAAAQRGCAERRRANRIHHHGGLQLERRRWHLQGDSAGPNRAQACAHRRRPQYLGAQHLPESASSSAQELTETNSPSAAPFEHRLLLRRQLTSHIRSR